MSEVSDQSTPLSSWLITHRTHEGEPRSERQAAERRASRELLQLAAGNRSRIKCGEDRYFICSAARQRLRDFGIFRRICCDSKTLDREQPGGGSTSVCRGRCGD